MQLAYYGLIHQLPFALYPLLENGALEIVSSLKTDIPFVIFFQEGKLMLRHTETKQTIAVDFTSGKTNYRRLQRGSRELIAKAVGAKLHHRIRVLDATAGLGQDAFILASLGCEVTMLESNHIVFALLQDGLKRAAQSLEVSTITQSMYPLLRDSRTYMRSLRRSQRPEVIYLDPMFPERKKSAKVKKEMQVLQALLQEEEQAPEPLFKAALVCATQRVVVKRPLHAPPLGIKQPTFTLEGSSCRFDVYSPALK